MTQQGLRKRKRGAQAGLAPRHSLEEGAFSLLAAHQGLEATATCQPSKRQTTDCRANAASNPVPHPTTNQITNPKPLLLEPPLGRGQAGGWGSDRFPWQLEAHRDAGTVSAAWGLGGCPGGEWTLRCPSVSCKQLKDVCVCSPMRRDTGGCVFGERMGVRGGEWEWMCGCGLRWGWGSGRKFPQVPSSFIPKHRKQTQPQGPSRSRRLPVSIGGSPPRPESVSSRPLPANNPGSVLCYPHSYTKGSVWKVGPRPKHETDRHSRGRKEVGRSRGWGGHQGTSSQSQQTGEKRAGKEG